MAAFTSKAAGNWSASGQTTWNEVGVPGNGDTVTISHAVTVTADTTIGDGTNTTVINLGNTSGSLSLSAGVTLTIKGNGAWGGYNGGTVRTVLTLAAGASVVLDSATGPIQTFSYDSKVAINGTSGSRCVVNGKGGSGSPGRFVGGSDGRNLNTDAAYCDFSYLGDATHVGWGRCYLSNVSGQTARWQNCTFDHCGSFPQVTVEVADATFVMSYCRWTNCVDSGGEAANFTASSANSGGTRSIDHCSFTGRPYFNSNRDFVIDVNYFDNVIQGNDDGPHWSSFDGNFLRKADSDETLWAGGSTNCFFLHTSSGAQVFCHCSRIPDSLFEDNVFQGVTTRSDCNCIAPTESGSFNRILTARGNILLANSSGVGFGQLVGAFHNSSVSFQPTSECEHNTVITGGGPTYSPVRISGLPSDGTQRVDELTKFRSNLFCATGTNTGIWLLSNEFIPGLEAPALTDAVRAVNCTNNAYCGLSSVASGAWSGTTGDTNHEAGTPYNSPMSGTVAPGAGDVNLGTGLTNLATTGPQFLDPTRTIQTWDTSLGGDGTVAHALARLAVQFFPTDPAYDARYTTAALTAYVRDGFAPRNPALHNTAHDGGDIGAVAWIPPPPAVTFTVG